MALKILVRVAAPILAIALLTSCKPDPKALEFTAYDMCQQFADDQMRDPDSTEWPRKPDTISGPDSTGNYNISVAVSSNNGFAGKTKAVVTCTVYNSPAGSDTWTGKAVVIG